MDQKSVMKFARDHECVFADVKFSDLTGRWHRLGIPVQQLTTAVFEEGIAIDASAIPGWDQHSGPELVLVPDPSSVKVDPFPKAKTLSLIGDVREAASRAPFSLDPRNVARKSAAYLVSENIGEAASFGAKPGFFIFDEVRFDYTSNSAFHYVDSSEAHWNSGREEGPNLGYKGRAGESRYAPPFDSLADLRQEMAQELIRLSIGVEKERHEAASSGQGEISLLPSGLLEEADGLQWLKYVLRNVAIRGSKTLTFMPKPVSEERGSAMQISQSLWSGDKNLFAGEGYGGLSETALHYIGGILTHAPALLAFCAPTLNSYRRLLDETDVPAALSWSATDRNAIVRTPLHPSGEKGRRVAFCLPDPSANGYLAFAALLMAGIDGIKNRIDPGAPLEERKKAKAGWMPRSLEEALWSLNRDNGFLLAGGVFTKELIERWTELKLEREIRPLALRTTTFEFSLYYDS